MTRPLDLRERLRLSAAVANDDIRTPYGDECRKRDAIAAVRDRFYRQWLTLVADMEAEIDRIKREGV